MIGNHHFGNVGDVWKHLLLCAILDRTEPASVWETHAGAARYEMDDTDERRYGARRYGAVAERDATLGESAYTAVLAESLPTAYPGSAAMAMELTDADCHFFDAAPACLDSIREEAGRRDCHERVSAVPADGLSAVAAGLTATEIDAMAGTSLAESDDTEPPADAAQTDGTRTDETRDGGVSSDGAVIEGPASGSVVHIDPFETFTATPPAEVSPVELFCQATNRGAITLLWYGFPTAEIDSRWNRVRSGVRTGVENPDAVWCGETLVETPDTPAVEPGLVGSHLLCGNLPPDLRDRCVELGRALAAAYDDPPPSAPANAADDSASDGAVPTLSFSVRSV